MLDCVRRRSSQAACRTARLRLSRTRQFARSGVPVSVVLADPDGFAVDGDGARPDAWAVAGPPFESLLRPPGPSASAGGPAGSEAGPGAPHAAGGGHRARARALSQAGSRPATSTIRPDRCRLATRRPRSGGRRGLPRRGRGLVARAPMGARAEMQESRRRSKATARLAVLALGSRRERAYHGDLAGCRLDRVACLSSAKPSMKLPGGGVCAAAVLRH